MVKIHQKHLVDNINHIPLFVSPIHFLYCRNNFAANMAAKILEVVIKAKAQIQYWS
ncbi:hypothetical protein VSWAT3_26171 [Vibrionales bacterium SWAT-3]|nr:hypothetical protein VSWAT3_26171 [Vibrionales bacterium SWAT-3]